MALSCQKSTRWRGKEGGPPGRGKEFSTNLFFFRLRSFDSPTPQESCHLPPPPPPAPPPPLLLAITHGDLTTSAPLAPRRLPWALGDWGRAGPGPPPLCRAQTVGGGEGESFLPTCSGQRHCPLLFLKCLKCNDNPLPSFAEGSLPLPQRGRAKQTGPRGQAGKASSGFSQRSWGPNIFNG